MSRGFRVEIEAPETASTRAKIFVFEPSDEVVTTLSVELKWDHKKVSNAQVELYDKDWVIFNLLPDPAFADIPMRIYMAKAGDQSSISVLIFEGKVTSLQAGFPGPTHVTVAALDKSVDARRQSKYRTFRNKNSVQIAKEIATDYGFTVETVDDVSFIQSREVDIGAELTDWEHLCRALSSDGLMAVMDGTKLKIALRSSKNYGSVFQKGEHPVIALEVNVNHVRGSGEGGDVKNNIGWQDGKTIKAVTDAASDNVKAKAGKVTHRIPVRAAYDDQDAHILSMKGSAYANDVARLRRRKDDASLNCYAVPDVTLFDYIELKGWGTKVDGIWFIETIKHGWLGADTPTTTMSLIRSKSHGAADETGKPAWENKKTESAVGKK
jgi:phage protein D